MPQQVTVYLSVCFVPDTTPDTENTTDQQKHNPCGVPIVVQWKPIQPVFVRMQVQSLASLGGSGILHCLELWCRSV